MLTENSVFIGQLPSAKLEPTYLCKEVDGRVDFSAQRFNFVLDSRGETLSTVTERYTLVQNADFVSALDLAADKHGISIRPREAYYHNGRSRYVIETPDMRFQIPNDTSETVGRIYLTNDYRGKGGLGFSSGWFRLVCTNGMVVGKVAYEDTRRHVGDIDVFGWVGKALVKYAYRFEVERVLAMSLAETDASEIFAGDWSQGRTAAQSAVNAGDATLVERIIADTAERYQTDLAYQVRSYGHELGRNMWALAQAVSDIATHRMQERSDGRPVSRFSFSADDWASRQLNSIKVETAK